jgi:hypothetical protein
MTSVLCNVKDIQESGRRWLEQTLGQPLQEDQQVQIQVVEATSVSDEANRRQAWAELERTFAKSVAFAEQHGISEQDIDEAVDEAVEHVRHGKP